MGSIIGKENVAEPAFEVLFSNFKSGGIPHAAAYSTYEIRRYGKRFVAEVSQLKGGDVNNKERDNLFYLLAGYIGVFGKPENEGGNAISMTAPVAIEGNKATTETSNKPTPLAMTAPVVIEARKEKDSNEDDGKEPERMKMQFFLPAEYDSLSKIPRPTNPKVSIHEVAPAVGAVHRYAGSMNMNVARDRARALAMQLQQDGLGGEAKDDSLKTEDVMESYQYWGYNPPFTIPMFRRNEIWVPLTDQQVALLLSRQVKNESDAN